MKIENVPPLHRFILDFFVRREGEDVLEHLFDVDLIESGLLDSLDVLELTSIIEEELQIKIDLTSESVFQKMRSLNGIIEICNG